MTKKVWQNHTLQDRARMVEAQGKWRRSDWTKFYEAEREQRHNQLRDRSTAKETQIKQRRKQQNNNNNNWNSTLRNRLRTKDTPVKWRRKSATSRICGTYLPRKRHKWNNGEKKEKEKKKKNNTKTLPGPSFKEQTESRRDTRQITEKHTNKKQTNNKQTKKTTKLFFFKQTHWNSAGTKH